MARSHSTEGTQRRTIRYAGSTVAIQYADSVAEAIDFLFRRAPAGGDAEPEVTYRVVASNEGDDTTLFRGEAPLYRGSSIPTLAELLLGDVCHELAKGSQGGLLFHAAGLSCQGRGVLLPGGIGAGKTTLAAWLTAQGLDYLSDEMIFFARGSDRLTSFTRPLNLKHSSRPALQPVFDFEAHAERILSHSRADLVPAELLNPHSQPGQPPLDLILFPRYEAGATFGLQRLTGAQTGLALMECLVNARNLPEHGFPEVVRLARSAPGYVLRYRCFEEIEDAVGELLRIRPSGV